MKMKLDDIDKKHPFQVPDGFFDELTTDIQSRVSSDEKRPFFRTAAKWSLLPALALSLVLGFWFFQVEKPTVSQSEILLAQVSEDAILTYLDETDISVAELISLSDNPMDLLETPNYLNGIDLNEENMDDLINTFDLNEIYL
ncbi:MAG: hypothetical protein ABJN36_07310 [Cyclobacteriaceae bacterium]